MRKVLVIVGSIILLYLFAAFIFPKYIAVPFASYNSKKVWTEHEKELSKIKSSELVLDSSFEKKIDTINILPEKGISKLFIAEDIFNQKYIDSLMPVRDASFYEIKNEDEKYIKYSYVLDYNSEKNHIYGKMESSTFVFDKFDYLLAADFTTEHIKTKLNGVEYLTIETDLTYLPFENCMTLDIVDPNDDSLKGFVIIHTKNNKLILSKFTFNKFFPIDWNIAADKLNKM